jgi:SAM-dependent methyltransferase
VRFGDRLRTYVPAWLRPALRALLGILDPIVVAAWRFRSHDDRPVPPRHLRASVGSGNGVESYFLDGAKNKAGLSAALDTIDRRFETFENVLDFGCGCGRTLQALPSLTAGIHGCDVNEPAVRWASEHLAPARFKVTAFEPPLPYEADSFDLIFAISVFTHLDEEGQDSWLSELRRITKPGGIALLTVFGELGRAWDWTGMGQGAEYGRRLNLAAKATDPFAFVDLADPAHAPGMADEEQARYGMAFHSERYIRERWSRYFEVLGITPGAVGGHQDVVVLQAPA